MKKYLVYGDPIHITLLHTDLLFFIIPPRRWFLNAQVHQCIPYDASPLFHLVMFGPRHAWTENERSRPAQMDYKHQKFYPCLGCFAELGGGLGPAERASGGLKAMAAM